VNPHPRPYKFMVTVVQNKATKFEFVDPGKKNNEASYCTLEQFMSSPLPNKSDVVETQLRKIFIRQRQTQCYTRLKLS